MRLILQNTLLIGADYYESEEQRAKVVADGGVPLGIGAGSSIKNCIVDKNARIGKNVVIENKGGLDVRGVACSDVLKCNAMDLPSSRAAPMYCRVVVHW